MNKCANYYVIVGDGSVMLVIIDGKNVSHTVMFDEADYPILATRQWHIGNGYVRTMSRSEDGCKTEFMHRMIISTPADLTTDHIDGNKLNNRRSNLRIASHAENQRNKPIHKENSIGIKGVTLYTDGCGHLYIRSTIKDQSHKERSKHFRVDNLGLMVATRDAAIWVAAKRNEFHGEFANHGRFALLAASMGGDKS